MPIRVRRRPKPREQEILGVAREVLLNEGFGSFSIESVAEAMRCSRPAIYKHFSCKEEIVLALAIETERHQQRLRERALMFKGTPRERLLAVGAVSVILFPRQLIAKLLVTSPAISRAKTSEERQEELRVLMTRGICSDMSIVRDAVASGDLVPPEGMDYHDIFFGLWAAQWGAMNFMSSDIPLSQLGFEDPEASILGALVAMMDGFGWRPLSTEWDYNRTLERLAAEVFPPDLIEEIGGRSLTHLTLPKLPPVSVAVSPGLEAFPFGARSLADTDPSEAVLRGQNAPDGSSHVRLPAAP
ncbi:MAG: TetR/AcrR family transcriptional regulator [Phycisphaerae bacterium]|nr:TetR/AcrR family transcriptional regulator [Phycisphaerae bacterium]